MLLMRKLLCKKVRSHNLKQKLVFTYKINEETSKS
jgi:hypothetical protein